MWIGEEQGKGHVCEVGHAVLIHLVWRALHGGPPTTAHVGVSTVRAEMFHGPELDGQTPAFTFSFWG